MARKVLFDSNNSLATVVQKNNQMSDWMGDLDDLAGRGDYLPGFAEVNKDNNLVQSADWLEDRLRMARQAMFGSDSGDSGDRGTLRFEKVLVADSAVIQRLTLGQLLSPIDSNTIIRDSLDSSYAFPPYDQRGFGGPPHQLHVTIDSGYIRDFHGSYLRVGKWLYIDSDLNKFYDSGIDSIGNWDTNFDSNYGFGLIIDSARIVHLSGTWQKFPFPHPRRYIGDSGYTDSSILYYESATFGKFRLATDSSYYFDSSNDSNFVADSSLFLNDSMWGNAITNTPGNIDIGCFTLDFESSYDSVNFGFVYDSADSNVGVSSLYWGKNVVGKYIWHDKLHRTSNEVDSQFCFTSLLEVYTDSLDGGYRPIRMIGGYLVSQYDSDGRI